VSRPRSTNSPQPESPREPLLDAAGLSGTQLGQVLGLLSGTEIVEFDLTFGSTRLSVRRPTGAARTPSLTSNAAPPEATSLAIASPLVGIFHPSVARGDSVARGQSIGAIESLGMPTTVDAPRGGTVEDVLVGDGGPVEYGQPLVVLRRPATPAE
jgi:biotin carboxyl carrier protein